MIHIDCNHEIFKLLIRRYSGYISFFVEIIHQRFYFAGIEFVVFVVVVFKEDCIHCSIEFLEVFLTQISWQVNPQIFFSDFFSFLGSVGQLILLVRFGHVEGRLVMEGLSFFEGFEVLGSVLDDVGRLITQYLATKVFEDEREVLRNGVFLDVSACHQLYFMK